MALPQDATRPRRAAGELESEVLGVLWAAGRPLTPRELLDTLNGGLAYNTIHTILTRLHDKGLVLRDRSDGRAAYSPVKDAAQLAAEKMRAVLERGQDRTATLARFVSSLSPEDEKALRSVLEASAAENA